MSEPSADQIYERVAGVLWRVAPDRVLLHRVGAPPEHASFELAGPVAMVWLALDEPGTPAAIATRLGEEAIIVPSVVDDLQRLVDSGLATTRPREPLDA